MRCSEHIELIAAALSKAQAVMEGAKKDSVNPFYHSKYADLAEVWDTCRKPLTDNGLSFVQAIGAESGAFTVATVKGKDGRDITMMRLSVTTRLLHSSGQWIEDIITMPVETDPQAIGRVTTYIRRYAVMAMCGVAPEDDDGESAAERGQPQPEQKTPPIQPTVHFCKEHNTPFHEFAKGEAKWWSHPTADGKWCNEAKKQQDTDGYLPNSPAASPAARTAVSAPDKPLTAKRDPSTIKTTTELAAALVKDFNMQGKEAWAELNIKGWGDLSILPSEAYQQIASIKAGPPEGK